MGAIRRWFRGGIASIVHRWSGRPQPLTNVVITSGQQAERVAEQYLLRHGLTTIKRNHNTPMGEIDLIMLHDDSLVFIEVKYRQQTEWAGALESVTRQKQQKIIKAAKQFLQRHRQYQSRVCRFDVLGIDRVDGHNDINWIQRAFE